MTRMLSPNGSIRSPAARRPIWSGQRRSSPKRRRPYDEASGNGITATLISSESWRAYSPLVAPRQCPSVPRKPFETSMTAVSSLRRPFPVTWPDAAATPAGVARRRAYTFKLRLSSSCHLQDFSDNCRVRKFELDLRLWPSLSRVFGSSKPNLAKSPSKIRPKALALYDSLTRDVG